MVKPSKVLKLELSEYGCGLHRDQGCFLVKRKNGETERIPHFDDVVGECVLKSGCYVSADALIDLCLWDVFTVVETRFNRVVGFVLPVESLSHVKTRVCQYEALRNGKGLAIAKTLVLSKLEGQGMVLRKYGFEGHNPDIKSRVERLEVSTPEFTMHKLLGLEAAGTKFYYKRIFSLFPKELRPESRVSFKAYDGVNNCFNFGYYQLKMRVFKAVLKAKLEPYLGFLHSLQHGKPSLVCDLMEVYRYLIDDFLITRMVKLRKKDFVAVVDFTLHSRLGKKLHLCEYYTKELAQALNEFFESKVNVPRIRHGKRQTLDTLICEEALLLAKFLRGERQGWKPRLPSLQF